MIDGGITISLYRSNSVCLFVRLYVYVFSIRYSLLYKFEDINLFGKSKHSYLLSHTLFSLGALSLNVGI